MLLFHYLLFIAGKSLWRPCHGVHPIRAAHHMTIQKDKVVTASQAAASTGTPTGTGTADWGSNASSEENLIIARPDGTSPGFTRVKAKKNKLCSTCTSRLASLTDSETWRYLEAFCGAAPSKQATEWLNPADSKSRREELDKNLPVFQTKEINRTQVNAELVSAAHMNGKDRGRLPAFSVPMRLCVISILISMAWNHRCIR